MKKGMLLLPAIVLLVAVVAFTDDAVDHEISLLKMDIQKEKVQLIGANMHFTPADAAKFWPIYDQYNNELSKIRDERVMMIKEYAESGGTLTDEKARDLTGRWFQTEEARLRLKKKYADELNKVLPATTVARFLQIENQLNLLTDLQIAESIPLVEK